jgi:tRNA threonylcarbamoyladenosine biosynthesis protein TsaB
VKVLGLDTATRATTVALLDSDAGTVVQRRDDPPRGARPRHTIVLMELVIAVLREAGAGWDDVERIAVGVGPGTFTGLRIGVATAQALSRARRIPLVGVSTLRSLALGAVGDGPDGVAGAEAVMAVIDARRSEVFAAGWAAADVARDDAEPLLSPRAVRPEALAQTLTAPGRRWLAVGDGAIEFREALERSGVRIPKEDSERNRVSAVQHCRLSLGLRPEAPEGIRPEYLRIPDAEISLRVARQR